MKLQIELSKFEEQVNEFVSAFEEIEAVKDIELYDAKKDQKLEHCKKSFVEVCNRVEAFLEKSITPPKNDHYLSFQKGETNFRNENKSVYSFDIRRKELLLKTNDKKQTLQRIYKIISISDIMLGVLSDKALADRKSFTIRNKKSFLLEKLSKLNDGWYYSLLSICNGNNIQLSRPDEVVNIAQKLKEENLVEILKQDNRDALVRLTIEGEEFVEDIIAQRLKVEGTISKIKKELAKGDASPNLLAIKSSLKALLAENKFKEIFEKLDFILDEKIKVRGDLIMLRGRYQSMQSKQVNGLLSDEEYFLFENKIRYDLFSVIESLGDEELL